jgi:hypothetical protein
MKSQTKIQKLAHLKFISVTAILLFTLSSLWLQACEDISPGKSNAAADDSTKVKKPCEENHTGDVCFKNITSESAQVDIRGTSHSVTVKAGKVTTVFGLKTGSYTFDAGPGPIATMYKQSEQFNIEECSKDTVIIDW